MDVIIEDMDEELYKKENNNNKGENVKKKKRKSKKIKKFNIYLLIITIIWLFMIFLNTFLVFKYDVLPFKYLIIYLGLIVLLPVILIFLITRKKVIKGLKIFISILGILYIILLSFSFFYLNKTFSFLDSFTSGYSYETKNYVVMVLKESEYDELNDINEEKIGYVKHSNEDMDKIFENLEEITFQSEEYKEYSIALNDLDNKEIKGIVLGDSYYQMLSEEIEDFDSKYKVIYEFSLQEKVIEIKKEVNVLEDTFNIYISGIDSYGSVNSLTRSDVNIVVSINPKTNQILMINIPRDYYVEFPGTDSKDKLTHAGIYGIDMSVKAIENLLDTEINYYFKVNYAALVNLVDALGGVDVYSKYSFTSVGTDKNYFYKKGYNHVNGEQALYFVRTRKAFSDGDRARGENQQAMISAIIKKAASSAILTRYTDILSSLSGSFATNIGTDKITDLVKFQLDNMPSWNVTSISLSGTDSSGYTYTYPYQNLYVMEPNEETILNAKDSLESVKKGEKLDSSYEENTGKVNTPSLSKPKQENDIKKDNKESSTEIKVEDKEENNSEVKLEDNHLTNESEVVDKEQNNDNMVVENNKDNKETGSDPKSDETINNNEENKEDIDSDRENNESSSDSKN